MDEVRLTNKKIEKSVILNEDLGRAWWRWTTHEGLKTFFGVDNKIELKAGGAFEIYFLMENPPGLRGAEGCRVLSYLPEKMLSFSWNAPPDQAFVRNHAYQTFVVVELESASPQETRVSLTHLGWPEGDAWETAYAYFDPAWEFVMKRLAEASGA